VIVNLAQLASPDWRPHRPHAAPAARPSEEQRTEKTYLDPDREPHSGDRCAGPATPRVNHSRDAVLPSTDATLARTRLDRSAVAIGIAVGRLCGRLDRGWNAASPSAR
jgi:hypothetical protein